jgi:hypothetical protein
LFVVSEERSLHVGALDLRYARFELPPFPLNHGKALVLALVLIASALSFTTASFFLLGKA